MPPVLTAPSMTAVRNAKTLVWRLGLDRPASVRTMTTSPHKRVLYPDKYRNVTSDITTIPQI
jgi:hypothetical protein